MELIDFRKKMKISASDEELSELIYVFERCNALAVKTNDDLSKMVLFDLENRGTLSEQDLIDFKKQLIVDNLTAIGKNPYKVDDSQKVELINNENNHVLSLMNSKSGMTFSTKGILDQNDFSNLEHEFVISANASEVVSVIKAIYDVMVNRGLDDVRICVPPLSLLSIGIKDSIKVKCNTKDLEYVVKMLESIDDIYKDKCLAPAATYGRNNGWYAYNEVDVQTNKRGSDIVGKYVLTGIEDEVLKFIDENSSLKVEDETLYSYITRMSAEDKKYLGLQKIYSLYKETIMPKVIDRIKNNMSNDGLDISNIYSVSKVNNLVDETYGKISYEDEFRARVDELNGEKIVTSTNPNNFWIPEFLKNPNRQHVEGGTTIKTPFKISTMEPIKTDSSVDFKGFTPNLDYRKDQIEIVVPDFLKKENLIKEKSSGKIIGKRSSSVQVLDVLKRIFVKKDKDYVLTIEEKKKEALLKKQQEAVSVVTRQEPVETSVEKRSYADEEERLNAMLEQVRMPNEQQISNEESKKEEKNASEDLTLDEVQNVIQKEQQEITGADYVVKYSEYMDNVAMLNAKLFESNKTLLEYFEENSLTERIHPTDIVKLHQGISDDIEITGKEFISNYLVQFLLKNSRYDLNYIINLYAESITSAEVKQEENGTVRKRSLFGLINK